MKLVMYLLIYEMMHNAIYCNDLIQCGKDLIAFADAALVEKNKSALVKQFYTRLTEYALPPYAFDFENHQSYGIFSGTQATALFIYINLPAKDTPLKSLKGLKAFGNYIVTSFVNPVGPQISADKVSEIMIYLDNNFNFSEKVFCDKRAMFLLLDNSHIKYNSECLIRTSNEGSISQHLMLYHMQENVSETPSPESVFFHELGHALHARLKGSIDTVPENILNFLKNLCFPSIDSLPPPSQNEIFADIISVGLMFDSPFSIFDPFPMMHKDDKKAFQMLARKLIEKM